MHKDEELLWQALTAGADGYLLKENLAAELIPALEAMLRSEVYISPLFMKNWSTPG